MENPDAQKPKAEQQKSVESAAAEGDLNFESPEAPEKLKAEAASETAELEADGLPVAEQMAARLDVPLDAVTKAELGAVAGEAESAKSKLVADLQAVVGEAGTEKREGIQRSYEYRDTEGNLIGRAEAEFGEEKVPVATLREKAIVGRVLRSLEMFGIKDGAETEMDLMALANPHGIEIVIAEEHGGKYRYDGENRIESAPIDSQGGIAVLLHELGHADQFRDPDISKLTGLYTTKMSDRPGLIRESLVATVEAVPELKDAFDPAMIDEIEVKRDFFDAERAEIERGIESARERLRDIQKAAENEVDAFFETLDFPSVREEMKSMVFGEDANERIARLAEALPEKDRAALSSELAGLSERIGQFADDEIEAVREIEAIKPEIDVLNKREAELLKPVRDLLLVPTRMMERDATMRAFKWMRRIREKAGIDLFKKTKGSAEIFASRETQDNPCVEDVEAGMNASGETDVLEAGARDVLRFGLESHKAKQFRFRKAPDDVGIMPTVKPRKTE